MKGRVSSVQFPGSGQDCVLGLEPSRVQEQVWVRNRVRTEFVSDFWSGSLIGSESGSVIRSESGSGQSLGQVLW